MKDWFLRFSLREQVYLLIMAVALTVYGLFFLVINPLSDAREELRARNESTAEALHRVDALAAELRSLRQSNTSTRGAGRNLTAQLNASANRFGLQIARLQPNSRGAVQLRFEAAVLDGLLRWIHQLETVEGLLVEELSFSQTSSAGVVSATLRVAAVG